MSLSKMKKEKELTDTQDKQESELTDTLANFVSLALTTTTQISISELPPAIILLVRASDETNR